MPLARIDLPQGTPPERRRIIGDVIYEAIVEALGAPPDDRFQIFSEHAPGDLVCDPSYLGIARSPACLVIQLTLNAGRSLDQKRAFYRQVADGLHGRAGIRREDVFISLVEVAKENWSFGNGEAQYAT